MDHEQTLSTIRAMRRQEETEYYCCDYFNFQDDEEDIDATPNTTISTSSTSSAAASAKSSTPCDASCRQIMFHWMVRVVDFFPTMHRETVAYAMNYLDRYLQMKRDGRVARTRRSEFQLLAISCLYLAVKIHEHAAVSPKFLEQLSRDEYTVADVERTELQILCSLKWKLSTPTALSFLRQYMSIIPPPLLFTNDDNGNNHIESVREEIYDPAKFQTEVALGDYKYVTVNASTIAFGALMNAMDVLQIDAAYNIGWFVSEAAQIKRDCRYTLEIQKCLAEDHAMVACINNHNNNHNGGGGGRGRASSSSSSDSTCSSSSSCTCSSNNSSFCTIGYEGKSKRHLGTIPGTTRQHSPRTVCKAA